MKLWRIAVMLVLAIVWALGSLAQDTALEDPAEEARAQALMRELRCVACENEPISQSAAPIAEDMRARVRTLIEDGKSDAEVRDWFAARYGEFVLFRPPQSGLSGWLLWGGPFVILLLGGFLAYSFVRPAGQAREDIEAEDV